MPATPGIIRRRSCQRFETGSQELAQYQVMEYVDPMDMLIPSHLADSLAGMHTTKTDYGESSMICIRPVRVALCKVLRARQATILSNDCPYILVVIAATGNWVRQNLHNLPNLKVRYSACIDMV